jgi:hypothetical protein
MAQDMQNIANTTTPVTERMLWFSVQDGLGPIFSGKVSAPPFHSFRKPPDEHKEQRHKKDGQERGSQHPAEHPGPDGMTTGGSRSRGHHKRHHS